MGFIEGSCVVGMTISPILGSLLKEAGGFNLPFYVFSGIFLAATMLTNLLIPSSVDGRLGEPSPTATDKDKYMTMIDPPESASSEMVAEGKKPIVKNSSFNLGISFCSLAWLLQLLHLVRA